MDLCSRLYYHLYRTTVRTSGSHSWAKTGALMQLTTVMFFNLLSIVGLIEIWLERKLTSDGRPLHAVLVGFVILAFHYSMFARRFDEIKERFGNISRRETILGTVLTLIYVLGSVVVFIVVGMARRNFFGMAS